MQATTVHYKCTKYQSLCCKALVTMKTFRSCRFGSMMKSKNKHNHGILTDLEIAAIKEEKQNELLILNQPDPGINETKSIQSDNAALSVLTISPPEVVATKISLSNQKSTKSQEAKEGSEKSMSSNDLEMEIVEDNMGHENGTLIETINANDSFDVSFYLYFTSLFLIILKTRSYYSISLITWTINIALVNHT